MNQALRLPCALLFSLSLIAPLSGCGNIQHDGTRTKTEGTLVGAGVGAGVGALLGQAIGGNTAGTLIGAGVGALVGGVSGFAIGSHVADKKAEYASREDWLDSCIADARQGNREVAEYNVKLADEIKALDKKSTRPAADYKRQKAKRETLVAEKQAVEKQRAEVDANIKALEERAAKQKAVAQDARAGKNTAEAQIMDAEVKKLESQIAEMKKHNQKLANISVRMAV